MVGETTSLAELPGLLLDPGWLADDVDLSDFRLSSVTDTTLSVSVGMFPSWTDVRRRLFFLRGRLGVFSAREGQKAREGREREHVRQQHPSSPFSPCWSSEGGTFLHST